MGRSVARTVAVSPHLDDAALSASVALARGGVTVATVFAALPSADQPVSDWDRLTGATSSRQRQRERLAEDFEAMRLLGARGVHLDEPEAQYRDGDPDLNRLVGLLGGLFSAAEDIWLPAAIGGHRDHRLAREAGVLAAVAAGHTEVTLYADFPYVIAYGWPDSVTGRPGPHLDLAYWLTGQLTRAGLNAGSLDPAVIRLSPGQRAAKAEIIAAYRTQAPALRLASADLARDPGKLDYELSWRLALGLGGPSPA